MCYPHPILNPPFPSSVFISSFSFIPLLTSFIYVLLDLMTHFPLASVSRHSSYQLLCFPQMISLEGISDSEGDVSATLALMAKVIRRVQVEVLRARFGDFAKRLDNIISLYQESGNGSLLVNVRQICVF